MRVCEEQFTHREGLHPFLSGMEVRLPPSVPRCPGDGRNPPQEPCSDHCQVLWMPLGTCTPPHSPPTSPPLPSPILQANASQFRASLSHPTPTAPPVAHTLASRFDLWSPCWSKGALPGTWTLPAPWDVSEVTQRGRYPGEMGSREQHEPSDTRGQVAPPRCRTWIF